ncbi:MAG: DUF4118 domain-containing protein, partial [Alphaproteobacteria bacterium]
MSDIRDDRPSPDALLAAARGESEGRLKVFLGAAPGVGKTYAMLQAAQRAVADGIDVVVGVIETHGRSETADLLAGLEQLPLRTVQYQDHTLSELDLDASLARAPGLLLVDELAHTNAPGSRHPKRHQDVEELLKAGIDVWTTLNIQHIESVNDIVAQITRVRVRETLPDRLLERADEVVLIDLTPDELIKRLKEGKVYVPAQAERAMANFFQPGNLAALRELALRRTAERVDSQMLRYMQQHAIPGPWPAGERILVCISARPDPMRLVRAGRRLADQLDAKWTVLHIETAAHARLGEDERDRIAAAMRLAEYLGAETRTVPGTDLVVELRRCARANNVTQLVLGKTHRPRWLELVRPSLVHELLRREDGIAIHVVPPDPAEAALRRRWGLRAADLAWRPHALSLGAVAVAGLVADALEQWTSINPSGLSVVFLAAVLYAALTFGLWPSVLASVASMLVYNFFFLPPFHTFTIHDPQNVLALISFLAVAIFTSNLASRVRDQAAATRRRFRATAALYDFSRKLAATGNLDDLLWAIAHQVAVVLDGRAVVLLPDGERLTIQSAYPPDDRMPEADWAAALWAWTRDEPAGRGSETLPNAERQYFPMRTGRGTLGVVGVEVPHGRGLLDPEQRRMLDALLDQAAVAIERVTLAREMQSARVLAETDKLRTALLSSLSHDLRTPLASIMGAATTLHQQDAALPESTRTELVATIREETERLNRFVRNLLDMTRIEAGALQLRRDWVDAGELIGSALARAQSRLGPRRIVVDVAPGLPLLRVDFTLFEQVLFNLLDNAAKYAPPESTVRLRAGRDGETIAISVDDEGGGIPPSDLERVFDKFYRGSGGDRQPAGTGLGLSICRGIVEAHG